MYNVRAIRPSRILHTSGRMAGAGNVIISIVSDRRPGECSTVGHTPPPGTIRVTANDLSNILIDIKLIVPVTGECYNSSDCSAAGIPFDTATGAVVSAVRLIKGFKTEKQHWSQRTQERSTDKTALLPRRKLCRALQKLSMKVRLPNARLPWPR